MQLVFDVMHGAWGDRRERIDRPQHAGSLVEQPDDHVKSIFEKVGVSSRGELVAKLFAEHYVDDMHASLVHAD